MSERTWPTVFRMWPEAAVVGLETNEEVVMNEPYEQAGQVSVSYAQAVTDVPLEDLREIPLILSRMQKAQEELFEELQAIEAALAPVVRESEPSKETSAPRPASATQLGRHLDAHAATIEGAAGRLRYLRSRIEL